MIPVGPIAARRRSALAPDVAAFDGAWTWFNDPRAISVGGVPAVGAISSTGSLLIYNADSAPSSVDLRGSLFQMDDHANPSILRRSSDGKVLVFASAHNGSGLYTYLSTNADDVSAFGSETNIDASVGLDTYSYTNPVQLTGETNEPIYLFFRAGLAASTDYYYSKSTNQGSSWAAGTKLLSNSGAGFWAPYVKMVQNGADRIDFFCTDGHPIAVTTNSIYHFYYQGGAFKKTDGTTLTLPITPATHLSKVYDGTTTRAWIWDCAIDESGNACCVFATFPELVGHRYKRGKWNGSSWTVVEITGAGGSLYAGDLYSGGVTLDPDDTDVAFASVEISGTHTLVRFEYDGSVWTPEQMTEGFAIRPYIVRGQVAEPRLAYLTGSYTSYTSFDLDVVLTDSRGSLSTATSNRTLSDSSDRTTSASATRTVEEIQ